MYDVKGRRDSCFPLKLFFLNPPFLSCCPRWLQALRRCRREFLGLACRSSIIPLGPLHSMQRVSFERVVCLSSLGRFIPANHPLHLFPFLSLPSLSLEHRIRPHHQTHPYTDRTLLPWFRDRAVLPCGPTHRRRQGTGTKKILGLALTQG